MMGVPTVKTGRSAVLLNLNDDRQDEPGGRKDRVGHGHGWQR